MTSSSTYSFDPGFATVIIAAYARLQIKRTMLTAEHLQDAGNEGNFLLSQWSSAQPLLWKSEVIDQVLTQGTATYTLPSRVVMLLDVYIRTGSGTSQIDRILGPLSTTEYDSLTNKTQQAMPTSYFLDRQITPTITFWQTPDGGGPYTARMRAVSQVQDASAPSGTTLDIPYRALDAFTAGLAHRLARIHKPELEQARKADAIEAWNLFSGNDVESVPLIIAPGLSGYFR